MDHTMPMRHAASGHAEATTIQMAELARVVDGVTTSVTMLMMRTAVVWSDGFGWRE
jgi:hypothetical protein